MAFWMNIHGCQLHPKMAIYVVKQLKNDSYRQALYLLCFRATFLANNPEPCVLNLNDEVQRESIAVTEYGYWTTSECKDDDPPCPLWFYPFASE